MGVAEWEAQLEASKQTFEEQLQSSKQVRPGEHRGSGSSLMIVPPFWRGPIGIHCVCPPLLSMLNLRSLTANVSTWRPSFKHLSRRQRSLGDQIQTSLLVVGVVVVLLVIVVLAVAVAVVGGGGGSGFDLGDALSLFPNSGKELEQESTRFSELDTRCEQLEAAKFLSHDSCWEFCT